MMSLIVSRDGVDIWGGRSAKEWICWTLSMQRDCQRVEAEDNVVKHATRRSSYPAVARSILEQLSQMIISIASAPEHLNHALSSIGRFVSMMEGNFSGINVHRSGVAMAIECQCLLTRVNTLMHPINASVSTLLPSNDGTCPCANTIMADSVSFANRAMSVSGWLANEYYEIKK